MGQVVTFRRRLQKICLCARSRIKQCSPSRQLNSCATNVAIALRTFRIVSSISLPNTLHLLWWVLYMVMLLTEEWLRIPRRVVIFGGNNNANSYYQMNRMKHSTVWLDWTVLSRFGFVNSKLYLRTLLNFWVFESFGAFWWFWNHYEIYRIWGLLQCVDLVSCKVVLFCNCVIVLWTGRLIHIRQKNSLGYYKNYLSRQITNCAIK